MDKGMRRALTRLGAGGALAAVLVILAAGVVAAGPQRSAAAPAPVTGAPLRGRSVSQPVPAVFPQQWNPGRPLANTDGADPPASSSRVAYPLTYPAGSIGVDISQYQCADIPSRPAAVAVVEVTGGALNNPPNPCYAQEAAWAGRHLTAYIYLDGLPNPAPPESMSGPAARCARSSPICRGYDFGFAWARHWVNFSRHLGASPKLWWLDVEQGSGWTNPAVNAGVIRGTAAGLRSQGVRIGIYSTPYQWATIAGTLAFPAAPLWIPGAGNRTGAGFTATAYCKSGAQTFAGGHLAMVQWGYAGVFPGAYQGPESPYDLDYVCSGGGGRGH